MEAPWPSTFPPDPISIIFAGQAKTLLAALKHGDAPRSARSSRICRRPRAAHARQGARGRLPARRRAVRDRAPDRLRAAGRRSRVTCDQLRALEGEWHFVGLQVDGADMPAAVLTRLAPAHRRRSLPHGIAGGATTTASSRSTRPPSRAHRHRIRRRAGGRQLVVRHLRAHGDQLTMCLGLAGASRPVGFSTQPGSGHALERLRRASAERPDARDRRHARSRPRRRRPMAAAAARSTVELRRRR